MTRPLITLDAGHPLTVLEAVRAALSGDGPAVLPLEPARAAAPEPPSTVHQPVALVIETSGSSGRPKRVALSADALLASAAASDAVLGGPGRWLLALPVHYIAGANVLVRSIVAGTDPVVLPAGTFDAARFVAAAEQIGGGPAYTSVVPVQLARLVAAAEQSAGIVAALRRFDRILVGGQATPPALVERARGLGLHITRTYGSSETAGGCVYDGIPFGTAIARAVDGEIWLSGPMLAEGYLADPARTEYSFVMADGSRWYRTGDAGTVDLATADPRTPAPAAGDTIVRVTGRLDNIIISGGIKVSLDDVERIARTIPGLHDAIAVSVESAEWGQVPVVVTTGTAALPAVRLAVEAALGRASAPARVVTIGRIPRLPSGKPDRVALRAIAAGPA